MNDPKPLDRATRMRYISEAKNGYWGWALRGFEARIRQLEEELAYAVRDNVCVDELGGDEAGCSCGYPEVCGGVREEPDFDPVPSGVPVDRLLQGPGCLR